MSMWGASKALQARLIEGVWRHREAFPCGMQGAGADQERQEVGHHRFGSQVRSQMHPRAPCRHT